MQKASVEAAWENHTCGSLMIRICIGSKRLSHKTAKKLTVNARALVSVNGIGPRICLNSMALNGRCGLTCITLHHPEKHIELSKKNNVNQTRYWRKGGWGNMTRREAMNYFDETGMLVRSSGTFDGQVANYGGGLREPDTSKEKDKRGRYPVKAKTHFFDNWRKQMTAWIREERNHASIYIWSVENEIAYINVNNLGQYRECEPELTKGVEHVMAIDPTRPGMVDGGNCLRDESLPVNGAHYTEFMNSDFRDFPDMAYQREQFYDKDRPQRGAWRMVPDRPIMKGEVYFANGYSTERFATIGGDQCFIGVGQTMEARVCGRKCSAKAIAGRSF